MATSNGSHLSSLNGDVPSDGDIQMADPWESSLQAPLKNGHGVPQMLNSGQDFKQLFGSFPSWLLENPDAIDWTSTQVVNLDTSSLPKQSPETRAQPGGIGFGKGDVPRNFVRKLFDMLSDESAKPYIHWNLDGKSFVIEKQEEFAKKVLKRYLKTENFQSFIRQLGMYDFHKINRAQRAQRGYPAQPPQFVFSHQKFQRDSPELLSEIKRKGFELQDAPPSSATLTGQYGLDAALGTQPLVTAQNDEQVTLLQAQSQILMVQASQLQAEKAVLLQAQNQCLIEQLSQLQTENQRLAEQLSQLQVSHERLDKQYNSLKELVRMAVSMPHMQDGRSSSTTN
ncbi:hypothetical protein FRC00_001517 [Tulasnella sp. 408]|nr:hypothetical protein FRC00_001517 [Tulasnella sp. 408]